MSLYTYFDQDVIRSLDNQSVLGSINSNLFPFFLLRQLRMFTYQSKIRKGAFKMLDASLEDFARNQMRGQDEALGRF